MTSVIRLECSVWTNGKNGWGVRILGGKKVREVNFRRKISPVVVEIDGVEQRFNVNKKSFWTTTCGELIGKAIRDWKDRHSLKPGDHVWLRIIDPYSRFRLEVD